MKKSIVLIGKESVGKSQLIRSLTGKNAVSERIKGTTVHVQKYETEQFLFFDTPGVLTQIDTLTSHLALKEIPNKDCVALVITATSIDKDLEDLLPLVQKQNGVIIITHWDKMRQLIDQQSIKKLESEIGVPIVTVDARAIDANEIDRILKLLAEPKKFNVQKPTHLIEVTLKPNKTIFEWPVIGKLLSLILLFLPAWFAVQFANSVADRYYDAIFEGIAPLVENINSLPAPLNFMLGLDYGIVTMFPFLVLYALPTVFIFSALWSLYKTSGLIDRLTVTLHRWISPFGLSGRDIVRVIMGYGCNVPAVISTRSCSSCTRENCISAISFGAACSYQLPATIAVFAAVKMDYLVIPYLIILVTTTLIYLRVTTSKKSKILTQELVLQDRDFIQWPTLKSIFAEMFGLIKEFFTVAFPIFLLICIIAGIMDWVRIIDGLTWLLSPVMSIFNLPPEAATSVVLGSIRKDGIAIGLLNPMWDGLKVPISSHVQILTAVYLSGVLLPCIVTLITITREMSIKFAFKIIYKQMTAAIIFSFLIAWIGFWLF